MCEFVSWIEKDSEVVFLTGDDVFRSKRGKELQSYSGSSDDLYGHGSIRWYYNFKGGQQRECTDFSSPSNFPKVIVDAIKNGSMRGLGLPRELLSKSAYAKYEKIVRPALAEYDKIQQSAWAEYEKIKQSAYAEYNKIVQPAFWDLFADVKNRSEAWK